jgi:glyoxylase-like metal-dependent hydrolase (beta-lactamase superfamily II)/rhodanese-related sulfurtransferase
MYIKQIYTNCLAQAAYYIESEGEAMIIDPLREPEPYLELAQKRNAKIKYVFETHFHADFVSGHLDIARLTDAVIVYGPDAKPNYKAFIAHDRERIKLGKIQLEVLHTPGHTVESSCILLYDEENVPRCIFTGDTLFIGDVGRPDLMSGNLSKEELAKMLYKSLNEKIKTLPDNVVVYPGHGAGSACGKNIGKETVSSIGEQKRTNYALQNLTEKEFVAAVTKDLPTPPPYFFKDAKINISGYDSYETIINREKKALSVSEVKRKIKEGAVVIDTRTPQEFEDGCIPGSVSIGLNGDYAIWVGSLIDFSSPLILVANEGKELESIVRLARVGYENVIGYVKGGITDWILAGEETEKLFSIEAKAIDKLADAVILDVRKPSERESSFIKNSVFITLSELPDKLNLLDKNNTYAVYCAGGYRSVIAASLLKRHGIKKVYNISGGITNVKNVAPEFVEFVAI